jgi:signal transduction histidine kinase
LQIDYTVPELTAPRRTRFRYRLEGFDIDWIAAGRQRQAIYTNLPPGRYRFVVEARTDDDPWQQPAAFWEFSVQPAFYQSGWFLALCAGTVIAAGWMAWRIRVRQVRKQFAMLLGERVRLSREIHDTLLQSLVGVALQCDALANDPEPTPLSSHAGLVRLRRQVEEYIRECRQSLWDLRSPTLAKHDLVTALRTAGERATLAAGITLDVSVDGTPRRCSPRVEEQLLRIGQEAVTNAARHARATRVGLQLTYESDAITLHVLDNGCGFDPADPLHQLQGHCGLISMRERAETVGGTCRITSQAGAGTSISILIPLPSDDTLPDDHDLTDPRSVYRRPPDRARRDRADHQPAA